MEPLKKIQVEGYAMFAEPEVLFGNLDELCCVTYGFCKEFIQLLSTDSVSTGDMLLKLFTKSSKVTAMRQAYHRYTLNYINALNYLETLRRQIEFVEFEKVSINRKGVSGGRFDWGTNLDWSSLRIAIRSGVTKILGVRNCNCRICWFRLCSMLCGCRSFYAKLSHGQTKSRRRPPSVPYSKRRRIHYVSRG